MQDWNKHLNQALVLLHALLQKFTPHFKILDPRLIVDRSVPISLFFGPLPPPLAPLQFLPFS